MNLFRSEEHLERWLGGRPRGGTMPPATLRALAAAWYGDRLSPTWRPRSREQSQAILQRLGLTGAFWRLPQPPARHPTGRSRPWIAVEHGLVS